MGGRANVYVHEGDQPGVYLYTHWAGTELPETLRAALARSESRWDDAPYLARIIFCEMVRGEIDGLTGYGISPWIVDGDRRVADVDTQAQTVRLARAGSVSFGDYVALSEAGWADA